jgi:heme/copper-type cytochrome/quinol oxidase subunit 2
MIMALCSVLSNMSADGGYHQTESRPTMPLQLQLFVTAMLHVVIIVVIVIVVVVVIIVCCRPPLCR